MLMPQLWNYNTVAETTPNVVSLLARGAVRKGENTEYNGPISSALQSEESPLRESWVGLYFAKDIQLSTMTSKCSAASDTF